MSACVREVALKPHCQLGLLAAEDCVRPLWWPQPQSVKDLEEKAQSEEKMDPAAAGLARALALGNLDPSQASWGTDFSLFFF